VRNYTDRLQIF